ncbi:chitinase, partial [Perkinsus olseni]
MASLSYILLAAVIWQSKALEYYAYFIGENLPVTRNISYFDDLFSAGVTEIIFVGFTVAANGTITRTFSNENELLLARQAANAHGARLSFMTGAIPFINDGPAAFSKFYASVNNMFEKYKFDGINFDWEFPATTDEWKKYRDLMKGTKENVEKNGRNANVSVAIATSFDLYKSIDLCGAVDKCLWMGYVYEIGVAVRAIHGWKSAQGLPTDKFALG